MAAQVRLFNNAEVLIEGNKLGGFAQTVGLTLGRNTADMTTINSNTQSSGSLLRTAEASISGLTGDENFESDIFNIFNSSEGILSFSFMNVGFGPGSNVIFSRFGLSSFDRANANDDFQKFDMSLETADEVYRGLVLDNRQVNATGALTGLNFGAVAANEQLIARIHFTSATDPADTVNVKVESDADNTFATPTDRIVFAQETGRGVQTIKIDGPITDTWFRFNVTGLSVGAAFDVVTMLAKRAK